MKMKLCKKCETEWNPKLLPGCPTCADKTPTPEKIVSAYVGWDAKWTARQRYCGRSDDGSFGTPTHWEVVHRMPDNGVFAPSDEVICEISGNMPSVQRNRARMIAKAPQMLAELKRLLPFLGSHGLAFNAEGLLNEIEGP